MANIRTARRSGLVLRGGGMRRESLWFGIQEGVTSPAAANTAVLTNSLNAAALALAPFTVVRTHIHWYMRFDQSAATETQQVALGQCVVSVQASAIGVTAVPTPYTDLGSDLWMLHATQASNFQVITAIGITPRNLAIDIDSKAMRKVEEGQDLILVMENSSISSGTFNLTSGRVLIKLH